MQSVRYELRDVVTDVNPSIWSEQGIALIPKLSSRQNGEVDEISVAVSNPDGRTVFRFECKIDRDMGGNGFVAAMNVDDDPEPEILCYRNTFGGSRYLDVRAGQVEDLPFDRAPAAVKRAASQWQDANQPNTFDFLGGALLTVSYYILLGIVMGIKVIFRRIVNWTKSREVS